MYWFIYLDFQNHRGIGQWMLGFKDIEHHIISGSTFNTIRGDDLESFIKPEHKPRDCFHQHLLMMSRPGLTY